MKLFTVGPVEMDDEIKAIGGEQVPYFRTQEFSNLMIDADNMLRDFMHAGANSKSIYLTASGTGALEATVINCLNQDDKVIVINGGTFGHRFVDLCEIYGIQHTDIVLTFGEKLEEKHFNKLNAKEFTALLVNIDETSTGQLYDIKLIADFCKKNNLLLIVDAISSFLCDQYDMEKYSIDATIISSQKGLCIAPGLSVVVLSERMLNERVINNSVRSMYFDFKDYMDNFKRGQTPFTPCVGICLQMHKALSMIKEKGLERHLQYIADVANDFRTKVTKIDGISVPKYPLSNAITPIIFDKDIATKVFEAMKDNYGITVNPTGGTMKERILRVAHIGNTKLEDNEVLISAIENVLNDLK